MFIFDILIYVFFAIVMYSFANKSYVFAQFPSKKRDSQTFLWMFLLFFAIVCGVRWNVGSDSVGYMHEFAEGRLNPDKREYLWTALVFIVSRLHIHYTIGMALVAFLQLYFLTKLPSKERYILIFLPIALFGGCYFLDYCDGMRQMLVASLFVFSTKYIVEKKPIKFLIFIFISYFIHHSVLILAPFFLLAYIPYYRIELSNKRVLCITIFIICFLLGQTPQFTRFVGLFEFLVSSLDESYNYVNSYIEQHIIEGDNVVRHFGPMQLSYFITALLTIWFGKELNTSYKSRIPYFELWWFFSFIYGCFYFLVCNVSFLFIRPFMYFEPFQLIIVSLLLFHLYKKKRLLFWFFVLTIWVGLSWNIIKNQGEFAESVTYKTVLFHDLYEPPFSD